MRVFFDTNVLIAAFVSHGGCADVFVHAMGHHSVFVSEFVLGELERVLMKKFGYVESDVTEVLIFLRNQLGVVESEGLNVKICRDEDDDFVLAGAFVARADFLVSGDEDLLVLEEIEGVRIISPKDYWKQLT